MSFSAPQIDYAGLSPVIALTAGICVVLLAGLIGEFYILTGLFQAKVAYAIVATIGVVLAGYYAIRLFQRTMHNRKPEGIESREISLRDGAVLVPLVACIVALALYPQLVLKRTDFDAARTTFAACLQVEATSAAEEDFTSRCGGGFDQSYEALYGAIRAQPALE